MNAAPFRPTRFEEVFRNRYGQRIGLLFGELPDEIYLAAERYPLGDDSPFDDQVLPIYYGRPTLELELEGKIFDALAWTDDLDSRVKTIADTFAALRLAHPRIRQLSLRLDPKP